MSYITYPVTGGAGTGTVTSVGITDSTNLLTVTGSPVTDSGSITLALKNTVNTASGLVQLDSSVRLPAVSGALLTGLTATQVGLSAVTNNAQVKKISSSTDVRLAVWDGTTGDLLKVGALTEANLVKSDGTVSITGNQSMVNVLLQNAPGTDLTGSGLIVSSTAGENLAYGDACYKKSDGKLWKAKGDAVGTTPVVGVAMGTISADASGTFMKLGFLRKDAWTWTVGGKIYLSAATAGAITQTAPSASGNQVQILGEAISATVLYIKPNLMVIELA